MDRASYALLAITLIQSFYLIYTSFFNHEPESVVTTEPQIVQSYTITRDGQPPVTVEVWEMEYRGETIRAMRFE